MSAIEALASKFDVVIGENTELSKNALAEEQQLRADLAAAVDALRGVTIIFDNVGGSVAEKMIRTHVRDSIARIEGGKGATE